jgi:hypothetical protein
MDKETYYEVSEYADTSTASLGDITFNVTEGSLSPVTLDTITIGSLSTYSDTYIHSNEVCVIDENGKEVKLLDELYRVSTELAVMRDLMSTLLEKIKLDPNVELDFDKRVEHHRMLNKLAGE